MGYNLLFLSENLDLGSHTTQAIKVLSCFCDDVVSVNISEIYEQIGIKKFEKFILETIEVRSIDVIWFAPGASCRVDPKWLYQLRSRKASVGVIAHFSDSEHLFECNDKYYAQMADVSFVHGHANVPRFEMLGMNIVAGQLFDLDLYAKFVDEAPRNIDVSFIGGLKRSNRKHLLENFDKTKINIYIAGTDTTIGRISTDEYYEVLNSSKIVLCFSGVASNELSIDNRMTQFKGRFIEATLSGAIPIVEKDPSIKLLCGNLYKDLNIFSTRSELESCVDNVLQNYEQERLKLKKLSSHLVQKLAPAKLLTKIFSIMKQKNQEISLYIDPIFGERFLYARIFFIFKFLFSFNLINASQELEYIVKNMKYLKLNMFVAAIRGCVHGFRKIRKIGLSKLARLNR